MTCLYFYEKKSFGCRVSKIYVNVFRPLLLESPGSTSCANMITIYILHLLHHAFTSLYVVLI